MMNIQLFFSQIFLKIAASLKMVGKAPVLFEAQGALLFLSVRPQQRTNQKSWSSPPFKIIIIPSPSVKIPSFHCDRES